MKPNPAPLRGCDADPINILIVDDEPGNLIVLETELDDPSYRLFRAESAEQALLALLVNDFALLILDIAMPGTSGLELARTIKSRKKTAAIPIVFLTAYYNEHQQVLEGYGTGAVDYLHKPVNPAILRSKVSVFVDLHRKSHEIAMANRALLVEVALRRQAEEQLRALSHRVIQAQEAERTRVALELHDHVTQLLCAGLIRSQILAKRSSARDNPEKQEAIDLHALLGRTAEEVERISRELRPSVLEHLGLVVVLQDTTKEFAKRTGVAMELNCAPLTGRLSADIELALYRILQEALKNVELHARARRVTVQMGRQTNAVRMIVKDDGDGFDLDHRPAGRNGEQGLGLVGMRERAIHIGGDFKIKSVPQAGTEIEVCIPLPVDARTAGESD